ncbi:hypothetical protein J1614_002980 [Plenodomus biglobosus]|nr:hypothetical protein J1614_002980 [Plenodomus biglobosus]
MKLLLALFAGLGFAAVATAGPALAGVDVGIALEALPVTPHEELPGAALTMPADGSTSTGFFFVAHEHCDGSSRKMKVQWMNAHNRAITEFIDISDPNVIYLANTPAGQVRMELNAAISLVTFHFNACEWPMDKFNRQACGFCMPSGWRGNNQQPDCNSKQPIPRTFKASCMFDYARSFKARDDISKVDNGLSVEIATPTTTVRDQADFVTVAAAASSVIEHPKVIVKLPKDTSHNSNILLIPPFHITITDYCHKGERQVVATYTNGDRCVDNLCLGRKETQTVEHKIPDYPNLTLGDFDWSANRLRFVYKDCTWYDDETWKECGECRAAHWSGQAPDCAANGSPRTKDMDCSMILGVIDHLNSPLKDDVTSNSTLANSTLADGPPGNFTLGNGNLPNGIFANDHYSNFTLSNSTMSNNSPMPTNLTLADTILVSLTTRDTSSLPSILLNLNKTIIPSPLLSPDYNSGTCTYTLTVLQSCSSALTTTLGHLYNVADNSSTHIRGYPERLGHIDNGAVRLPGFADFRLAWDDQAQVVYFSNGGKWWRSDNLYGEDESANHNPGGSCVWKEWEDWSGEAQECWRASATACQFEC